MLFDVRAAIAELGYEAPTAATSATSATRDCSSVLQVAEVAEVATPSAAETHADRNEDFEERAALIEVGADVPREWSEGYAALCVMPLPEDFAASRWQQIINDAGFFLDAWAEQAAALGWSTLDTFGINRAAPDARFDGRGLVASLSGRRIVAITADTATVVTDSGGTLTAQRRATCIEGERILVWQLSDSRQIDDAS